MVLCVDRVEGRIININLSCIIIKRNEHVNFYMHSRLASCTSIFRRGKKKVQLLPKGALALFSHWAFLPLKVVHNLQVKKFVALVCSSKRKKKHQQDGPLPLQLRSAVR